MFTLASLPESFRTMVTTLAASTEDVPSMADVKEKLRSEELRHKQIGPVTENGERRAPNAGHGRKHYSKSKQFLILARPL